MNKPSRLLFFLLLCSSPLMAQSVIRPAGHGHESLAYAADGRLGELVQERNEGDPSIFGDGLTRLLYRERTPGAAPGAWEQVVRVEDEGADALAEAALNFDGSDRATVTYLSKEAGGSFRKLTRSGGVWTAGSVWPLPAAYAGMYVDAAASAAEADGTRHVLLLMRDIFAPAPVAAPLLVHGRLAEPPSAALWTTVGGPFTAPTKLVGFDYPGFSYAGYTETPRHMALAMDAAGGAHAVYSVNQTSVPVTGGTQVRSSLFYVMKPAGGSWSAPQTIVSPGTGYGDGGLGADIAVAADGTVAVATAFLPRANTGSPGDCVLRYLVKQPNGTWNESAAATAADGYQAGDGPQGTGLEAQIVFDAQSHPRITFTDHASQHGFSSGASSFSGQVRLAARAASTSGLWTMSKLVGRGSVPTIDFMTFRPAIATRHGQTAVAATSWAWNSSTFAFDHNYQLVLQGTVSVITNPPPVISNIVDHTTSEDMTTASLVFTVSDANTPLSVLTLSGTSSNPTLVPSGNIVFGGSGANRTVTITPAANQSGTATIMVTVSDGSGTASDTFVLNVTAVNDPPVMAPLTDRTVNEDTSTGAIALTVGDVETAAGSLTLTRASSNTALVPLANVVLGGSGANRTVTVTPAANQSGTATITVTVGDGGIQANRTFLLTVLPVNDPPTVSNLANVTTNEDTATKALAFTVADVEAGAGALTVGGSSSNQVLVPAGNIVFGGSGANRTVAVTPAANQSGTATVTVTVGDGNTQVSKSFLLTVLPVNDPPTLSGLVNLTTNEDTSTGAITFNVGDVETAADFLTLTRKSSNTKLVPLANVVLGGSGANRTVTITPAANQSGTAAITVTVGDGNTQVSKSFLLTVLPENDPPVMASLPDRTINEDTSTGAIAFTVGDAETAAASLILTRMSSNTALVPLANVVLGGSGASRTVTVTPAANQSGTAIITVTVGDGSLQVGKTFLVTVLPVNDPPTISNLSKLTTNEDTATQALPFVVSDAEAEADTLLVNSSSSNPLLVPPGNILLGGGGATRTITVTPTANQSGTATISVAASDGANTATQSFVLTVNPVNDPPMISDVAPVTLTKNSASNPLPFTVSDVEMASGALKVTCSSSDIGLLPLKGLVLGGSGANRTLIVKPAANRTGTAAVTLTVSDGNRTTFDMFTVTVVDAPPIQTLRRAPYGTTRGRPFVAGDTLKSNSCVSIALAR